MPRPDPGLDPAVLFRFGTFDESGFCSASSEVAWLETGTWTLADELEEAANRIGGLGRRFWRSG